MHIEYGEIDSTHFAINPIAEKVGDRRLIHFESMNCTHVLLVSDLCAAKTGIFEDPEFKKILENAANENGNNFLNLVDYSISDKFKLTCINYLRYQMNNRSAEIQDTSARYHICGLNVSGKTAILYLPKGNVSHSFDLTMEIRYIRKPFRVKEIVGNSFGRKKESIKETPFYYVRFEQMSGYVNGAVTYSIGIQGRNFEVPITREMLGKAMLIKKPLNSEIHFKGDGVVLRQVEDFQ